MYYNRIIHRFWAGREMPAEYVEYGKQWLELHPGWELIDWDLSSVMPSIRQDLTYVIDDLYRRDAGRNGIELYVQIADVVGYHLVYRHGGVYVNCDQQPLKNIEPILPTRAWASYENNEDGRIVNSVIGAPGKQDPFWGKVIDGLSDNYFRDPSDEMVMSTGPGYLTRVANENRHIITVLDKDVFNPVHWKQIEDGGDAAGFEYPETAYGVHHWGHRKDKRSNHIETATQFENKS